MPLKQEPVGKLYWTIGEVAVYLGVNASMLRYWEKAFGTLRPRRGSKGDRLYTDEDIEKVRQIQHLLKERGFTIQGAREQLRSAPKAVPERPAAPLAELQRRLVRMREELLALREQLAAAG